MLTIADVLSPEDLTLVRERLQALDFEDGRRTAGPAARQVKRNTQAAPSEAAEALGAFVRRALLRSDLFTSYARPVRWSRLLFSRYEPGDGYGLHVDDAAMGCADGGRLRTDLSFTLFLSDPESYGGGALRLDGLDGERLAKPPAGSVVLYPTGVVHEVTGVTAGERLACVGWLQSAIRREDEREVLFDLTRVRAATPNGEGRLLLDRSIGALLRLWSDV